MTDIELKLYKRLYNDLDYYIKLCFYNFAVSHFRKGGRVPEGWRPEVKYICHCIENDIPISRPTEINLIVNQNERLTKC